VGNPLSIVVTAGQRHESIVFEELMDKVKIKNKKGRPKQAALLLFQLTTHAEHVYFTAL